MFGQPHLNFVQNSLAGRLPRHERLVDNIAEQLNNMDKFEWQAFLMFNCFFWTQARWPPSTILASSQQQQALPASVQCAPNALPASPNALPASPNALPASVRMLTDSAKLVYNLCPFLLGSSTSLDGGSQAWFSRSQLE